MPLETLSVTPKSKEAFVETVAVVCPEETEPQDEASTSRVVAEDPEFEMPEEVAMVEQPGSRDIRSMVHRGMVQDPSLSGFGVSCS